MVLLFLLWCTRYHKFVFLKEESFMDFRFLYFYFIVRIPHMAQIVHLGNPLPMSQFLGLSQAHSILRWYQSLSCNCYWATRRCPVLQTLRSRCPILDVRGVCQSLISLKDMTQIAFVSTWATLPHELVFGVELGPLNSKIYRHIEILIQMAQAEMCCELSPTHTQATSNIIKGL